MAQYTTGSDGLVQLGSMHTDHLGSVVVVSNEAGAVVARYSDDAWGRRRNADGSDATITAAEFDRGFTAHAMLDALGLAHMNGCVYDPTLGRFIAADPIVQAADRLVSYNRYAYVMDNPLTLCDLTGYKALWRTQWLRKHALPGIAIAAPGFAGDLRTITMNSESIIAWGHSQGTLILQGAMDILAADGFQIPGSMVVNGFGAAANLAGITASANRIGAVVGDFLVNQNDPVATIVGRNASSMSSILRSIGASPRLFMGCESSTHSRCAYFPGR